MLDIQALQCPKCGAMLEVGTATTAADCSYCGAHLRVTKGASGRPLATLDDLKEDTSVLAAVAVWRHIKDRLDSVVAQRDQLWRSYIQRWQALQTRLAEVKSSSRGTLNVLLGVGRRKQEKIRDQIDELTKQGKAELARLDPEIAELKAKLKEAESNMDGFIGGKW